MHLNDLPISNNILFRQIDMDIFKRMINRLRFRKTIKRDESVNVVDSMAKARILYKELCIKVHPDKNNEQREIAEDLMQRIVANRCNYAALLSLKQEVVEKLQQI